MKCKAILQISIIIVFFNIPVSALSWQGKVVNVADGDTITVLHDGKQEKIRLYGVDCPEKGQAFGSVAHDFTANMVAGKVVDIEDKARDRYGRTVSIVSVGSEVVNLALVEGGCAWVYSQYCKEQFCKDWAKAEESARNAGTRMWGDPHIVPPWEWRHGGEKKIAKASIVNSSDQEDQKDASSGEYHGNVSSHKFHGPNCRHYDCSHCTRVFSSRSEAIAAGYAPCKICNP